MNPTNWFKFKIILLKIRLKKAIINFKYKKPKITQSPHREFILNAIRKVIESHETPIEIKHLAEEQINNIINGWKFGVRIGNRKLNQNVREFDSYTIPQQVVLLKYFCEEIEGGRIGLKSQLLYEYEKILNYIPLAPIDKETNKEVTFITVKYGKARIARHGSYASSNTFSMNDEIPPWEWKVAVPMTKEICATAVKAGYYALYAKADEKDSFRQLGIHRQSWVINCYKLLGMKLIDTRDIYGSRSASKHKQELGVVVQRAFLIWIKIQVGKQHLANN